MKRFIRLLWVILLAVAISCNNSQKQNDAPVSTEESEAVMVKTGFASPPASARVWVFWDWLNGYVNTQQITADLEAMHSRGIGGAMIFQVSEEAGYGMPTYGSGPVYPGGSAVPMGVEFMTGPWRALFAHAVKEAHRLGIEIGLMAGSGYCLGGPWITPEHAGRRVVWSETKITGPQRFSAVLPAAVPQVDGGKHVPFDPATVIDIAVLAVPAAVTTTPVKEWQWKAAYREDDGPLGGGAMAPKWLSWAAEPGANDPGIPLTSVINLTAKLVGGRLEWDVPAGEWTVLRIAHALGGRARQFWKPGEGGPLMDYMSAEASDVQFEATIAKLVEDIGPLAGTTFTTVEDDSPDFGDINWTWTFADEFKKRRGYDIVPYLPALMGRVVVKRSVTERFLYDFRKTMADLKADNHYGRFSELCRKHGLKFMAEAGGPPPAIVDGLQSLSRTDVPMGEFWAGDGTMSVRGTASVAHTTGGRLVAAEAFTSWTHWLEDPLLLKPYGDRAFCEGVNRCVIHNFASQRASDGKPGYVYMAGTHFEPNITWWNQSQGWIDYLTRCQFMLQQGLPVADVCVFSGVGVPNFVPPTRAYWYEMCPSLGEDYACDVASDEVVRNRFTVSNGRLALSDGMSYRLLTSTDQVSDYPSPSATMFITPELCTRLKALLNAGATVVWPRPGLMPGLSGSDSQLATQISNLWGAVPTASGERNIGKGKLIWGKTPRQVLAEAGVAPDFEQQPMATDRTKRLAYIHRRVGDTEIYFVSNRDKVNWNEANCLFRVQGKAPELWYPDNGAIIPHTVHEEVNGRTWLPLRLPPAGSVFVVFRTPADATRIKSVKRNGVVLCAADSEGKPETSALEFEANGLFASQAGTYELLRANGTKVSKTVASIPAPLAVAGPWSLRFLTGPATPGDITMNSLISWTEHSDPKVRYFSGTAAYRTTFTLPTGYLSGDSRVYLNLGVVKNLAEVTLNGRPCGLLWKHPFRVDVTDALQPGDNTLEVRITNLWPNRLIGDQNSPADQRVTRTNMTVFKKDSPLLESGLLGPVVIETAKTILTSASTSAAAPSTPLPQP